MRPAISDVSGSVRSRSFFGEANEPASSSIRSTPRSGGVAGRDQRADARAADDVHVDAGFGQRPQHPDVGEPARAAAAEHEAGRAAADAPREAAQRRRRVAETHVVVRRDMARARATRAVPVGLRARVRLQQHELAARRQPAFRWPLSRRGRAPDRRRHGRRSARDPPGAGTRRVHGGPVGIGLEHEKRVLALLRAKARRRPTRAGRPRRRIARSPASPASGRHRRSSDAAPCRARATRPASRAANAASGTPGPAGISAKAFGARGRAPALRPVRRSRSADARAICIIARGWRVSSASNDGPGQLAAGRCRAPR